MRIARVANFYGPASGGLRTALHALGEGSVARGDHSLIVVPGDRDETREAPFGSLVTVRSPAVPGMGGYRVMTRLDAVRAAIAHFGPDVLEISDRTTLVPLARWGRDQGILTAFVAHERADGVLGQFLPPRWHGVTGKVAAAHTRAVARRFDLCVATTGFAGAELEAVGAHVATVPLGVDLEVFHPDRFSSVARGVLCEDQEVLLVMASRLSKEKRPDVAISAVAELLRRGRRVRLVVAGAGPLDGELRRMARSLPVTWLGFVRNRASYAALVATADVLLAPGPVETFGLAALESLAAGTPVVVASGSALPEVVGDAGLAAPSTGAGYADAVEALLARDPRERRIRARTRAESFAWDESVTRLRAVYQASLGR